jgi:hypothetical protein
LYIFIEYIEYIRVTCSIEDLTIWDVPVGRLRPSHPTPNSKKSTHQLSKDSQSRPSRKPRNLTPAPSSRPCRHGRPPPPLPPAAGAAPPTGAGRCICGRRGAGGPGFGAVSGPGRRAAAVRRRAPGNLPRLGGGVPGRGGACVSQLYPPAVWLFGWPQILCFLHGESGAWACGSWWISHLRARSDADAEKFLCCSHFLVMFRRKIISCSWFLHWLGWILLGSCGYG